MTRLPLAVRVALAQRALHARYAHPVARAATIAGCAADMAVLFVLAALILSGNPG